MNSGGTVRLNYKCILVTFGLIFFIYFIYNESSKQEPSPNNKVAEVSKVLLKNGEINLKELLSVAINAAESGGKEVKRIREKADSDQKTKGETKEGAKEFVTDGDIQSHMQMFYGISNTFPGLKVIKHCIHGKHLCRQYWI